MTLWMSTPGGEIFSGSRFRCLPLVLGAKTRGAPGVPRHRSGHHLISDVARKRRHHAETRSVELRLGAGVGT